MSKLHVLVLTALVTSGCAAQVDEREMNYLASALTKVSASVDATVRYGGIPSNATPEEVLSLSTQHDPLLLEPFDGKRLTVRLLGKNSVLLVCDGVTQRALLEDTGCTARMDSHRWTSGVNTQCEFTLNVEAICGR